MCKIVNIYNTLWKTKIKFIFSFQKRKDEKALEISKKLFFQKKSKLNFILCYKSELLVE